MTYNLLNNDPFDTPCFNPITRYFSIVTNKKLKKAKSLLDRFNPITRYFSIVTIEDRGGMVGATFGFNPITRYFSIVTL